MNHSSWLEWAIILFIIGTIGFILWKGGSANPVGTGRLSRKVGHLTGEVGKLGTRMQHVEAEMEELKAESASTKDIERLEERINGHHQLAQRTHASVERIERFLIEKGLGK